jgi:hypothetical protein
MAVMGWFTLPALWKALVMTYIKYQHFNLRLKSEALIDRINWIIDEYQLDY